MSELLNALRAGPRVSVFPLAILGPFKMFCGETVDRSPSPGDLRGLEIGFSKSYVYVYIYVWD